MQCRYCRAWNEEDERRCVRCGRRLVALARPVTDQIPFATSTAPALELLSNSGAAAAAAPALAPQPVEIPEIQPSLFRDVPNAPKVIPIPTLTPMRPRENPELAREWAKEERRREESAQRKRSVRPPRSASKSGPRSDSQQALDFYGVNNGAALNAPAQAVIYCDAPVATPTHRVIAAAIDSMILLFGLGLFFLVFWAISASQSVALPVTGQSGICLLVIAAVLSVFYRFLCCVGNGDTPGMHFAGLRLIDFDGRVPDRERRGMRQIAGALSIISAGLGLVWALVDEENLTWHDHISKTFPTAG